MKKFIALITVAVMMFSLVSVVSAADVTVDLAAVGGTKDYGPHGYTDVSAKMFGYGSNLNIGTYDLSKYASIRITYATDGGFVAKKDGMPVTAFFAVTGGEVNGGVGQADSGIQNEDKILGKADCADATITNENGTNWDKNERTAVIDISNVTYNGEVYLYHYNSTGNEALVVGIELLETAIGDGEGSTDDKNPSNPATSDLAIVAVSAIAAFALAGVVVCKKARV